MTDKQPTQAMGTDIAGKTPIDGGRKGGGESGGGAYADPDQVKGDPKASGYFGHGGQSNNSYSGPGDAGDDTDNPNATAK
jgi:hypothetical protein